MTDVVSKEEQRSPEQLQILYQNGKDSIIIIPGKRTPVLSIHYNNKDFHITFLEEEPNFVRFIQLYKYKNTLQSFHELTLPEATAVIQKATEILSTDSRNQLITEHLQTALDRYQTGYTARQKAKKEYEARPAVDTKKLAEERSLREERNKQLKEKRARLQKERALQKEALKKENQQWEKFKKLKETTPVAEHIDKGKTIFYSKLNNQLMFAAPYSHKAFFQIMDQQSVRPMKPEEVLAFYEHLVNHFEGKPDLSGSLNNFMVAYGQFLKNKNPIMTKEEAKEALFRKILPRLTEQQPSIPEPLSCRLISIKKERS